MTAVKKRVRLEALRYLRAHPGRDSLANNPRAHGAIKSCRDSPKDVSIDGWEIIWEMLHYR